VSREPAITRLVMSHVAKAEKARRHGRELSFILPHNAVDNFAPLFSAIEYEINTRASRLGISSYGVSMTTLEEVRNSTVKFADLVELEMVHCLMKHTYFLEAFFILKITCVFTAQVYVSLHLWWQEKSGHMLIIMKHTYA